MKLAQFVLVGMLLHLAVATSVDDDNQSNVIPTSYHNQEDPQLWQKSGQVEGDMILTPAQHQGLYKDNDNRNGVINTRLRWPNRRVPYAFSNDFTASERDFIAKTLRTEYARTCISVVPRTNEADYVYITGKNTGCWSMIGRVGGRQELNLERGIQGCIYYRTIVHELMHAVGFYHQHASTERDDYVTIQWGNVQNGQEHNFDKYGSNIVTNFGQRYDYASVMHYDAYAFSKNGQRTIIPKQNVEIGRIPNLSTIDITKINRMYGC